MHDPNALFTCDDHVTLNGYSEVMLIAGMHEHAQASSEKSHHSVT
jgi:hypothetical protein